MRETTRSAIVAMAQNVTARIDKDAADGTA
jgi:hypothetical protein